ncbi:MAG: hypothetical protein HY675_16035 [Chloroflexi bacterium]|nr:hypothetical protein [Chloroflexota bacterium]
MSRSSIHELAAALRVRYQAADRAKKKAILDEFLAVSDYHRKSAIRLLLLTRGIRPRRVSSGRRPVRPSIYAPAIAALQVLWEGAGCICSRRLQPFLPKLLTVLRRHGGLVVQPEVEELLCKMSISTMDRLLYPLRQGYPRRVLSTTKAGRLLKESIPLRTFADWNEERPGFLEADLVAHCGDSAEGFYLCTLSTVDILTGWLSFPGNRRHDTRKARPRDTLHRATTCQSSCKPVASMA